METRRLRLLLELSRLGSMREVADAMHVTTSTVSQQLAVLARETGAALIEPDGRRVRLTPAGRRLAAHAVDILAAVDAARLDLDPAAEPAGTLRVASFAAAIRRALVPVIGTLARDHPRVRLHLREHEPAEALSLLAADEADLALTYDYDLAPATFDPAFGVTRLWSIPWALGVPDQGGPASFGDARDLDWIVNSRNTADDDVIRTVAALEGFEPRIVHRADSLGLVQVLIVAGLGVGLLPADMPVAPGVRLVPLTGPEVHLRAYAVVRRGRAAWPALALVLKMLRA
ncbi:LysR family transcriptional regulator [Symbioplanes lichenis]|uniref:LysR family transcriptional regulator n=1 Tax=Symbioplanes lichenis TaxID=1629072 RepID=UPI00273830AC|nr:LysR substrate-binding domain-containing protein [Actinoplanes lichenis]